MSPDEPIVARHPSPRLLGLSRRHARKYLQKGLSERMEQKRDAGRTLPRARVTTTRGAFVVELFQHETPNTVNNFVWLSRAGFYDGLAMHRNLPFFALQTGDPFSREGADPALAGLGGPGYDIVVETSKRLPVRGNLAMVRMGGDAVGSQFLILTGTAAHLEGEVVVFGRVVEGQDVVDALVLGDRIESVEIQRVQDGWTYHPTDLSGALPEAPVATAPPAPGR